MYGRIIHNDQSLLINGEILSGIQGVSISSEVQSSPTNVLGFGYISDNINNLPINTLEVDKIFLSDDSIVNFVTGDSYAHAILRVKDKYLDFSNRGCINTVSLKCSTNSLVNSSFSINAYGDVTTGIYSSFLESGNVSHPIKFPTFQSVVVNTDSYNFDRITDLTYSITLNKEPIYGIGSRYPVDYYAEYPIEETLTLTVEIDDLRFKEITERVCVNKYRENILIDINSYCENLNLFSINFKSGLLTNQNFRGQVNEAVVMDLTFTRYSNELFSGITNEVIPSYQITGYYPTIQGNNVPFTGSGYNYRIPPYTGWAN